MDAKTIREPITEIPGDIDSLKVFSQIDPGIFDYEVWYKQAVCRNAFKSDGEPNREFMDSFFRKDKALEAKFACMICPVKQHCLTWALIYNEEGVWGGTTEQERKAYPASHIEFLRNAAIKVGLHYRKVSSYQVRTLLTSEPETQT